MEMTGKVGIPLRLQAKVDRELEAGEVVEWLEMQIPRFFTPMAASAFLFGIPWTAFAVFWTAMAAWGSVKDHGVGPVLLFPLVGIAFVLAGFGLLSSPLWAYWKALSTVYVVTNRRAITFDGGRTMTIRSFPPSRLQDIYRKEKKDGTGDVIISYRAWKDSENDTRTEELGFLRVRDPKDVEARLRKLAELPIKGEGNSGSLEF